MFGGACEKAGSHRCNPGPVGHDQERGGSGSGDRPGDHQGGTGVGKGGNDLWLALGGGPYWRKDLVVGGIHTRVR